MSYKMNGINSKRDGRVQLIWCNAWKISSNLVHVLSVVNTNNWRRLSLKVWVLIN